ncbi:MAG: beta-galactosidase trimerization domain-containing protein, partial [Cyclobacteriaceae bacterium]
LDEKLVAKWENYVNNGGYLVLSTRTGLKDTLGHLWEGPLQAPIVDLIGAKVVYYDHLPPGKNGRIAFEDKNFEWNVWGDVLEPLESEVWATYQDQFYQGKPAVVHHKLGKGSVTYIGAWSNDGELERQVLRKLYQQAGAKILDLPSYVFTEWRDGFWVTVNYTSEKVKAPVPDDANVLFGSPELVPGGYVVWEK